MNKETSYPCAVNELKRETLHKGRNILRLAVWNGAYLVVKDFGRSLLGGYDYIFRKSKARRSYENARALIERGISTPRPVAYRECRNRLTRRLIGCSYICTYEESRPFKDFSETADRQFISCFAAFVAELHCKGIRHDDLNNTNVRVVCEGGSYKFSLIDLNRMRIYPSGKEVPISACPDNLTRFSSLDDNFLLFAKEYVRIRRFPSSFFDVIVKAKKRHDRKVDRKKRLRLRKK